MLSPIRIAVDIMGGDNGPNPAIAALIKAKNRYHNTSFIVFGNRNFIDKKLFDAVSFGSGFEFINVESYMKGEDSPIAVLRGKNDTSMSLAVDAVKDGSADAVVSSGNTGAFMVKAKTTLKTINNIERPAICSMLPSLKGKYSAMLDMGANTSATSKQLFQFAIMGNAFFAACTGKKLVKCGLLNIGLELTKGTDVIKEAHSMLSSSNNIGGNFIGYVESRDIIAGKADVLITDGFTGNMLVKSVEGSSSVFAKTIERSFKTNIITKLGYFLVSNYLKKDLGFFKPQRYNGAMLVGLNGICVKSHGNADAESFLYAIDKSISLVRSGVNKKIKEVIDHKISASLKLEKKAS